MVYYGIKIKQLGGKCMLKISSKSSTLLSIALSIVFFVALVFGAIIMPKFVSLAIGAPIGFLKDKIIMSVDTVNILLIAYLILAAAAVANVLLFILLLRVKNELVFTDLSISLIRGISWCVVAIGVLFAVLTYYFTMSSVISAVAFFLGLCLRVVKNVIERATEIKNENDLTV